MTIKYNKMLFVIHITFTFMYIIFVIIYFLYIKIIYLLQVRYIYTVYRIYILKLGLLKKRGVKVRSGHHAKQRGINGSL